VIMGVVTVSITIESIMSMTEKNIIHIIGGFNSQF
jgi:hypothetical protein